MTPLRSLLAGAAALALIPGMASAQSCMPAAEKASFDVRALQSQLMVVAITCEMQDDYNRFVTRFQPQLATAYRGVAAHFRRTGGRNGQRDLDQYITGLANGQSQVGIAQGQYFCGNQRAVFQQALAAGSADDLARISVQREIPNIISTAPCSAATPARAASTRAARPAAARPAAARPAAARPANAR